MEIFINRALREQIIRALNAEYRTSYNRHDIVEIEFTAMNIYITTKDGSEYNMKPSFIWK